MISSCVLIFISFHTLVIKIIIILNNALSAQGLGKAGSGGQLTP